MSETPKAYEIWRHQTHDLKAHNLHIYWIVGITGEQTGTMFRTRKALHAETKEPVELWTNGSDVAAVNSDGTLMDKPHVVCRRVYQGCETWICPLDYFMGDHNGDPRFERIA